MLETEDEKKEKGLGPTYGVGLNSCLLEIQELVSVRKSFPLEWLCQRNTYASKPPWLLIPSFFFGIKSY